MNILYVTSEAAPFCKTGGLADVAGSLPLALAAEGADVSVVLPLYQSVKAKFADKLEFVCYDYVDLGWRNCYCGLFMTKQDGVTWYFIDNEQYFNRPTLYGHIDDGERFGFFSRAVVRMLDHLASWPDVIHCNDWQSALVPVYLEDLSVREEKYHGIATSLSIHNIEYQGKYNAYSMGELFGLDQGWATDGTMIMDGCVNLLKGAILTAGALNAVSPTYAKELMDPYFAHGLDSVLQKNAHKMRGILNGIDLVRYNPATDGLIAATFSKDDLAGKAACKQALQDMMGLPQEPNIPVVGLVSRLVSHKGLDLMCQQIAAMMELPMQLVVLGKGDEVYEEFFRWAQTEYPGRIAVRLDYNEALSSAIYAGSDLYVMPSKSEPCGLSQMIAMRYGTVPVVRETGGLKDSVQPYDHIQDSGNGFSFAGYTGAELVDALRRAVYLYKDFPEEFAKLRGRAMESDFSWNSSAKAYLAMYEEISGKNLVKEVAIEGEDVVQLEVIVTETITSQEIPATEPESVPIAEVAPAPKKRAPRKKTVPKTPAKEEVLVEEAPKKRGRPKKVAVVAPVEAPVAESAPAPKKRAPRKKAAPKKATEE
ncbi:glycogen synthase GlgA [Bengtsoniella intestinalis]|uniref:glycogen synthase GlgA n=1 Tax=Bengtsoniella intestinalis TaxID=3073143 RepID=UPI00391F39D1